MTEIAASHDTEALIARFDATRAKEQTACMQGDLDRFFPIGRPGSEGYQAEVAAAKRECARCPLAALCMAVAVAAPLPEGVFGGTTPEERRKLRQDPASMDAVRRVIKDSTNGSVPIGPIALSRLTDARLETQELQVVEQQRKQRRKQNAATTGSW